MTLSDFGEAAKGIVTTLAPTAATMLGGPLAGLATQKVISALGLAPEASANQIEAALVTATPEQLLELKKVDAELTKQLKSLDVDIMKLEASDIANARQREVATQDWTPRILATLVFTLYVTVTIFVWKGTVDVSMREIALRSLGTLDAAVGLVLGYYFGSSIGSHKKDEQITNLSRNIK